ncbi:MAG: hypothetical protein Q7R41_17970 [Phycisphaerales bacterium]|nr:hypothetical protein [Phycisphaerales bacterium]
MNGSPMVDCPWPMKGDLSSAFACARFWGNAAEIEAIEVRIEPPEKPLAILEALGPSPFERGGFPLIGFLATTYDKVSRYALECSAERTGER